MKRFVCIFLSFMLVSAAVFAQDSGKKKMTMRETLLLPSWGSYTWSKDGNWIAFTKSERDPDDWERETHIWLYDVDAKEDWQLTYSNEGERSPEWLPDGRLVFNSSRDGENKLYVISIRGGEAQLLYDDEDAPAGGTFSPDYKKLAYTKESDRPDQEEWDKKKKEKDDGYYYEKKLTYRHIWVYDPEDKAHKRVTAGDFDNSGPVWSPDGEWIVFTSNRSGAEWREDNNSDIWIVPSDSGAVRQLTTNEGPDRSPEFSPDGKKIAYTASPRRNHRADQYDIMVIPVGGGTPENLTPDFDYSVSGPTWSPDGNYIYFSSGPAPSSHLYRVPAPGGEVTRVTPDNEYVYGSFEMTEDGEKWLFTGSSWRTTGEVFVADITVNDIENVLSPTNHMGEFEVAREEVLTWKGADGWDIDGILTYPLGYEEGKRYPTILMVHGGPFGSYRKSFSTSAQIWAARGYAVIRSNPRGSSGYTLEFGEANVEDWGGRDFTDIMNGVDRVIEMGVADPERLGVMGGSYGGFMTFWTITQTDRFRAAIGHAGISDWFSFFGQTDIPQLLDFGFGGKPYEAKATYEKWSPIEHVKNVKTPLLITHGEQDYRVNIQQADQYYRSLKFLGKTVEYLRFPREGHGIGEPRHRLFLDREQDKWMAKYLMPERYERLVAEEKEKK